MVLGLIVYEEWLATGVYPWELCLPPPIVTEVLLPLIVHVSGGRYIPYCPCARAVFTGREHGCRFGHPLSRAVFTGARPH